MGPCKGSRVKPKPSKVSGSRLQTFRPPSRIIMRHPANTPKGTVWRGKAVSGEHSGSTPLLKQMPDSIHPGFRFVLEKTQHLVPSYPTKVPGLQRQ